MKFTISFLFIFLARIFSASDIIDDVASSFKDGNASEISKYFSSNVGITVLEKEGTYSVSQSQLILKDFFAKHPPINVKIIHKVLSNPEYKLGVILYHSTKGIFRISFDLKKTGGNFNITQIRIEENKD